MRLRVIVFALVATAVAVGLVLPSAGAKPPKPPQAPQTPQVNDHYGRSHDYFKLDNHHDGTHDYFKLDNHHHHV